MSKYFILLISTLSLILCVPRIRTPNYNEEELVKCLKERNIEYNEQVEELRGYYDTLRNYLFSKKFEEYKFDKDIKEDMTFCFEKYGLKASRVSPYANCMDRCKYERPGTKCSCPRY